MEKAELIFVPSPGIGHLVATLEFAKRLVDHDDRILITVLVMKLPFTTFVDAYTKSFTASQSRIQVIDLPEVEPPSSELLNESIEYYITLFIDSQLPHVRNIVSDIVSSRSSSRSVRVTGLVVDFFCLPMIDVASELRLPSYIFLTSNAGFLGLMLYLPTRHDQISTVFEPSDSELSIPGFVNPVPVSVLPLALIHKLGYSSYIKLAQRFKDVNGIIVNTFSELEPYAVNSFSCSSLNPPVYTVGPVLELKGQPNPDLDEDRCKKILKWLDDQPESSVAFLCFGSGGSFGPAQVKEIATGLEQSEYKFLWSLRVSPPNNEVPVIDYSTNDDVFPEGFMERIRGRGMICDEATPFPHVDAYPKSVADTNLTCCLLAVFNSNSLKNCKIKFQIGCSGCSRLAAGYCPQGRAWQRAAPRATSSSMDSSVPHANRPAPPSHAQIDRLLPFTD
ncbi:hypothetical protein QYF36_026042 [Acer negundo]|nr:hypothetical protein QYF36_026042 [Acer negundo]